MTSKLPAVKGLPCVQNHLTWADASLKPCHTRSFLCQPPQPFSLSSSLAIFFIPSLLVSPMRSIIMCRSNKVRYLFLFLYSGLFWGHGTFCVYLSVNRAAGSIGNVDSFPQFFLVLSSLFFFFSGQTVASQAPLIKSNWLVGCVAWPVTTFWCSARDMWRDRPYLLLKGWHMAPAQLLYSFPFSSSSLP